MSLVKSRDTKPEWLVRRIVFAMGHRYRLHDASLPGRPDIVFRRRRKAIFVHGCFWHQHSCSMGRRIPKSRVQFWREKLDSNKLRDRRNRRALRKLGWKVLVVWECQLRDEETLKSRLRDFLEA